jgi:hypothetical protein
MNDMEKIIAFGYLFLLIITFWYADFDYPNEACLIFWTLFSLPFTFSLMYVIMYFYKKKQ